MCRGCTQQVEEALTIAETRIATLEADLSAAVAVMFKVQENHASVCGSCIPAIQAVLSRPGVRRVVAERDRQWLPWVGQAGVSVLARERDQRLTAFEAALRDIAQAASEAADALAMHAPATHSWLDLQGCFEAIADAALAALKEDSHDD